MAKIITMPGPRERRLMAARYGIRTLGDVSSDGAVTAPWYTNPYVILGAVALGGIYLGGIGHRETLAAGRRHRRRARQAKALFHAIDWSNVSTFLIGGAILSAAGYYIGKSNGTIGA